MQGPFQVGLSVRRYFALAPLGCKRSNHQFDSLSSRAYDKSTMPSKTMFRMHDKFACHLQCQQCAHVKADGLRCKNRVCFGTPVCWMHTKTKYKVRAKTSTIPNAGKGLFATALIPAGSWICPYIGEQLPKQCIEQRYGTQTAPYVEMKSSVAYIDSACMRGIGSMANALFLPNGKCRGLSAHNCKSSLRTGLGQIWLKATKTIQAGQEIFHWYGNEYRLQHTHVTERKSRPDNRPC